MRRLSKVVLAVSAGAAAAAEPPAYLPNAFRPAAPSVADLVRKLGSPLHAEREAAGRQLLNLPDNALPALDDARRVSRDPEVRGRLDAAVEKLRRDQFDAPRRVTLHLTDVPLTAAFAEIARQSGYPIRADALGAEGAKRESFRLTNVPFWEAVDAVCAAGGFAALPGDEAGSIGVYNADTVSPFATYSGPFRVLATNVTANRHRQLSGLPRQRPDGRFPESITLHLQLSSEPRWPILAAGPAELVAATDAAGANLRPPAETGTTQSLYLPSGYYRSHSVGVTLNLGRDFPGANEIARLRARVPVTVLAQTRPMAVVADPLAPGASGEGRSVLLKVADASRQANEVRLTVTLARKPGATPPPRWNASLAQRLELYGPAGGRWSLGAVEEQRTGGDGAALTAQFLPPPGGADAQGAFKLVLNEWVPAVKVVEFELKGLPLP